MREREADAGDEQIATALAEERQGSRTLGVDASTIVSPHAREGRSLLVQSALSCAPRDSRHDGVAPSVLGHWSPSRR